MKKLLSIVYFLFVFLIPIGILYGNVDKYLITATTTSIDYLQSYLDKLLTADSESVGEFKSIIFKAILITILFKVASKFIFDRKLGLSLKERKGDWIITIWQLALNCGTWFAVYQLVSFFKINTDAWLESFNIIIVLVGIGVIAKLTLTYIHYTTNLTKKA